MKSLVNMDIKSKHFYYNEEENTLLFVKEVETRKQGNVEIVWACTVNKKESLLSYYASGFLFNHKLVGFLTE